LFKTNSITSIHDEGYYYVIHFPWPRTGPGTALDGNPKFDLSKLEQGYFDRLRQRVIEAGDRGIYVSIMLFEGWGRRHQNLLGDGMGIRCISKTILTALMGIQTMMVTGLSPRADWSKRNPKSVHAKGCRYCQ
jgi:hypothetical protein